MKSIIDWIKSWFEPKLELSEWYFVSFDEQNIYVKANPPNKEGWEYQFEWSGIEQVCFEDNGLSYSDCLYIGIKNQEQPYMIPTEASGGSELFIELNKKGFFPDDLMLKASTSTDGGLYCYPAWRKKDNENNFSYNGNQLTPPKYAKIAGFLGTIFCVFLTFITAITPVSVNKTATWYMVLFFGVFTFVSIMALWSCVIYRHSYDDKGLTYTTFFNKKIFLAWQDIEKIEYSYTLRSCVLINRVGKKFYISDDMVGLNDFLQILHEKVPNNE